MKKEATDDEDVVINLQGITKDIFEPEFYAKYAQLERIELMQGAELNNKPHYEATEQFMCLIEGSMSMILVPHVFRQEVQGGILGD